MKKLSILLALLLLHAITSAQQSLPAKTPQPALDTSQLKKYHFKTVTIALTQPYGVVDTADLTMKVCDFEKDANAEVLFDRASATFSLFGNFLTRHKRIKILNEKGKENANIKIEYHNLYGVDHILRLEAETINLDNGKIVITKVDSTLFYNQHTDKSKDAIVFTFPNVKPGSVIEYRYELQHNIASNFPAWYFQSDLPTRYSQFGAYIGPNLKFNSFTRTRQPFVIDTSVYNGHIWGMTQIASSKNEAFMRAPQDGCQSISLLLSEVEYNGENKRVNESWAALGKELANEKGFYKQLDQKLDEEDKIITQANAIKSTDERIAYVFNTVKNQISWNDIENWSSIGGIKSAWKKKSGNSAEINAILYHLLKKCNIKAYPMLVSTRENGLLDPGFVNLFQINNLVVYIPVDSTKHYIMDASSKYSTYNQVPFNLLNGYGLSLNKEDNKYDMVFIEEKAPSKEVFLISAAIGSDGKMKGSAHVYSYKYNRSNELELYKTVSKEKFETFLTGNDNNLLITDRIVENTTIDTLPLHQQFNFTYDLNNSENYLFFTPNIFMPLKDNPLLSEHRNANVDFGYKYNRIINGAFKLPGGFRIESLPKNTYIVMPDNSIRFNRSLQFEDGNISIHYEINFSRTRFSSLEYPVLHEFYKKMYEMLNEQIVLKKS